MMLLVRISKEAGSTIIDEFEGRDEHYDIAVGGVLGSVASDRGLLKSVFVT